MEARAWEGPRKGRSPTWPSQFPGPLGRGSWNCPSPLGQFRPSEAAYVPEPWRWLPSGGGQLRPGRQPSKVGGREAEACGGARGAERRSHSLPCCPHAWPWSAALWSSYKVPSALPCALQPPGIGSVGTIFKPA